MVWAVFHKFRAPRLCVCDCVRAGRLALPLPASPRRESRQTCCCFVESTIVRNGKKGSNVEWRCDCDVKDFYGRCGKTWQGITARTLSTDTNNRCGWRHEKHASCIHAWCVTAFRCTRTQNGDVVAVPPGGHCDLVIWNQECLVESYNQE